MTKVLVKTYYHYGIDKTTYDFESKEEALNWIKENYSNAEEIDYNTFHDEESDSTIEIL